MSSGRRKLTEGPLRVKGGCGRSADGTAGLPQLRKNPCVPVLTLRAHKRHRGLVVQFFWSAWLGSGIIRLWGPKGTINLFEVFRELLDQNIWLWNPASIIQHGT
jgi:hypothetical protein